MVAAAPLPASAQTFVAVIFTKPVGYYASLDDYASAVAVSRRGQTESGMHLCVAAQLIRYRDTKFAQLFLPDGQVVYMDFAEAAGDYTLDPANNKKCQENAALYAQQAAQSARRNRVSSSPVATSQPQQAQSKPVAPTPAAPTYGPGTETTTTDTIRAELKEVLYSNGEQIFPHGGQGAYEQNFLDRAEGIASFFYLRRSNIDGAGVHWSSDKDLQDFVKAKRWYQIALDRIYHGNNPNVASGLFNARYLRLEVSLDRNTFQQSC